MRPNPEIQRYLWEDFSFQRTIGMPVTILAITLMGSLISDKALPFLSVALFFGLTFLWGGAKAASAVIEEINGNTWDNHRLSPASPWSLSFGKLFGSTLYVWYGGLIALAIYVVSASRLNMAEMDSASYGHIPVIFNVVLLIATALLCQASSLLASVQTLHVRTRRKRLNALGYFMCGGSGAYIFFHLANMPLTYPMKSRLQFTTEWYGITFDMDNFVLGSMLVFLAWALTGIVRSMREELKLRNIPWVWGLFLLFLMIYASGFTLPDMPHPRRINSADLDRMNRLLGIISPQNFGLAFSIAAAATYAGAFSEPLSLTRYRMWVYYRKQRNWRKAGELTPRWMVSLAMMLLAGIVMVVSNADIFYHALFFTGLTFFLLRDLCILHFFLFAANNRRAYIATIFYLFVLYVLLPGILGALRSESGVLFFVPVYGPDAGIQDVLPALVQFGIAAWLLARRWKKANMEVERAGQ